MKILLLPSYFYPEGVASPYLSRNRNQRFADEGWEMVVYTPTPSRGISIEKQTEYRKPAHRNELMLDGKMRVHRFHLPPEKRSSFIRAVRYFIQNVKQFNRAVFSKDAKSCDVMLVASTPPTQGAMAGFAKMLNKKPLIYNLQDVFPDSLVSTGMTKEGSFLWKIGRRIENFTYRRSDVIIVISEDFKRNIIAKGVPEEKIEVIRNWVEEESVVDIPRSENVLFSRYGLDPDKFYLTYSGNIGMTQNLDMLLDVMDELKIEASDIRLVMIGEGAYKSKMEENIKERNLSNVLLLPFQPYEEISHVFSLGDVGVVISKPGVGANSVPSKTWSIMSASRPVLASFDENELKDIILEYRCGIFTKAGDKDAFKEAILEMYHHPDRCREYGINGRKYVMDNLTKSTGTQRYVDVIKRFEK